MGSRIKYAGITNAWLRPEYDTMPLIPIASEGRLFGCDAAECDVVLRKLCAARIQAEIVWNGKDLTVVDRSGNGQTLLNGEQIQAQAQPVYVGDVLDIADERFSVVRRDGKHRPELKFKVEFACEGEILETSEYTRNEKIRFPDVPKYREEDDIVRMFDGWIDSSGAKADKDGTFCERADKYSAKYREQDGGTVSVEKGILINYKVLLKIPEEGFCFGGSKLCNSYIRSMDGVCAKVCGTADKITVYMDNTVTLNGKMLASRETAEINEADRLVVAGKICNVIGKKKVKKIPVLRSETGIAIRLTELDEGKKVVIGREHQKELQSTMLIGKDHAQISCRNGIFYIRDMASKNGTFIVNADGVKRRVYSDAEVDLHDGDRIGLSEYISFTFSLE